MRHSSSSVGKKIGFCTNLPVFKCLPSGEVMIVRATEKINPFLLNKIIKSEIIRKEIQSQIKGIHLYPKDVEKIKIPLPPLEVQEQIVAELENYQKVIDGAQAVVENWKPSFEIDQKWPIKKLGEISERVTKGTTPTTAGFAFQETGINFVKIEAIDDTGYFIKNKFAHINEECNKAFKNVSLISDASTYGKEDGSFAKHIISLRRKGLKSQIACGYLFYRVSVGNRSIQQEYENLYMRSVNSQFGGHILPNAEDTIRNENLSNKTEILIPLETISYDGKERKDIHKADWASLLNVSDQIDFELALNTTNKLGRIDSVEIAYKCWNQKTGEETKDCELEVIK